MSMINDVQAFLVANGHGSLPENRQAWPIFLGILLDDQLTPDAAISLHAFPGSEKPSQWSSVYSRLLVQVRGSTDYGYAGAEQKIQNINTALHATFTAVGSKYKSILATSFDPIHLGADPKRRHKFSLSFDVILNPNG